MCLAMLCLLSFTSFTQTTIKETIKAIPGKDLKLSFKYPKIVKITTWEKNEIEITGDVNINNGRNDEAFQITTNEDQDFLFISSSIKDHDDLPKMKVIVIGETKYFFDSKESEAAIKKLKESEGSNQNTYSMYGVIKEITLEVKIPRNIKLSVDAKHGLVELKGVSSAVKINSKFGGIDMSILPSSRKNLEISTRFGEIYTNLDFALNQQSNEKRNHWEVVKGTLNGGGTPCELASKFGNIYIRKEE